MLSPNDYAQKMLTYSNIVLLDRLLTEQDPIHRLYVYILPIGGDH